MKVLRTNIHRRDLVLKYKNDLRYVLLTGFIKKLKNTKLFRNKLIKPKIVLDELFMSPHLVLCEHYITPSGPECGLSIQRVFLIVPNAGFTGQLVMAEGVGVKNSVLIGWELFSLDPDKICVELDLNYRWLFEGYKDGNETCTKMQKL